MINWQKLLTEIEIPFRTKGKNVLKDCVAINCPFCEGADPSFHLNLSEWSFRCWRDPSHEGKDFVSLLDKLDVPDPQSLLEEHFERDFSPTTNVFEDAQINMAEASLPDDATPFNFKLKGNPYVKYMRGRGFDDIPYLTRLIDRFSLSYCPRGRYAGRIVLPYVDFNGKTVTFNTRTIHPATDPKYYVNRKGTSGKTPLEMFYGEQGFNNLTRNLVICEGPFDVLKGSYLADRRFGNANSIAFLGLSTKRISIKQQSRLFQIKAAATDAGVDLRIFVALDGDVPYKHKLDTARLIGQANIPTFLIENPLSKDIGEMNDENFEEVFAPITNK